MKRKGFTLAEILISLAIIGIIVAIGFPAVNSMKPDKNKVMYLKVHDELKNEIASLATDSSLFPACKDDGGDGIECASHPLLNTMLPVNKKFSGSKYEGNKKLCNLMAYYLNVSDANCSESTYSFNAGTFNADFNSKKSFTTQNGVQWWIIPQANSASGGTASYQTDIYVDIDSSSESPNCIYNKNSCKNPDRFKFMVSADASVIAADPMGEMYINTRKSYLKTKKQNITSDTILAGLDANLKTFDYEPCVGKLADIEPGKDEDPSDEPFQGICPNIPSHETFGEPDSYNDDNTVAYLRYVYEMLSNAFDLAVEKHGDPTNWGLVNVSDYQSENDFKGSKNFYTAMKDGIDVAKDCGRGTGCFAPSYKFLFGSGTYGADKERHIYKVITKEGISIAWHGYSANCNWNRYGYFVSGLGYCGRINVDIDGPNKGPSVGGKDWFEFMVTKNGVLPHGFPEKYTIDPMTRCLDSGAWCVGKALRDCNRAYMY